MLGHAKKSIKNQPTSRTGAPRRAPACSGALNSLSQRSVFHKDKLKLRQKGTIDIYSLRVALLYPMHVAI